MSSETFGMYETPGSLKDINPIKLDVYLSHLRGTWPFKRGLVKWTPIKVAGLLFAFMVSIAVVAIIETKLPGIFARGLALSASGTIAAGLLLYAVSDRGVVMLFCPAQRALSKTNWLGTSEDIRCFNRDLARAQNNELFLANYDRVPYTQVVSHFVELRAKLVRDVEAVTQKFSELCETWCAAHNWVRAKKILGPVATTIDIQKRQAEIGQVYSEMATKVREQ